MLAVLLVASALPAHAGTPSDAKPAKKQVPAELDEITRIMTKGKGPDVDPMKAKTAVSPIDPKWDPAHVWLVEYKQHGTKLVLLGGAADPHDIAEFAKRLQLSRFFEGITIVRTERKRTKKLGPHYEFKLTLKSRVAEPSGGLIVIRSISVGGS
ncbi:MAG TPA: PilN domain-containing protein [Kofleriaceae bacterium]